MRMRFGWLIVASACAVSAQTFSASPALDRAIEDAIAQDKIPGAVLLVGSKDKILHLKAYGNRSLVPERELMTVDTIFDCASLTKVVATSAAVMKLVESGDISLNAKVTQYLPEYQGGKSDITVRHLLTHFSGLRPDVDLKPEWSGYETGIHLALADRPRTAPGERFVYSDINYILLGEIVRRQAGMGLPGFVTERIWRPLGMTETWFQPSERLRSRIAPTEMEGSAPLRGVVHDPTTRFMGGIAGHAGMFSTAGDLAKFAQMILRGGSPVFGAATVAKYTSPQSPPDQTILRGLGWDIDSPFSGNRGELYPIGSFGHTGFTGTSMWIDPKSDSFVILLTNYVHPKRRPVLTPLRSQVATIAAAALGVSAPGVILPGYNESLAGVRRELGRTAQTQTGLDVLAGEKFEALRGLRIGLITNHTGVDREGRRNLDLMIDAGVNVTAVLAPEHGVFGVEDRENVGNTTVRAGKAAKSVPVLSLYDGGRRRPAPEMLSGVDALVFDIQDIGARFYTYISTMGGAMEEAAKARKKFFVLDRPNPVTGTHVEGPVADERLLSFIGYFPMALRHGMTIGEIARMIDGERKLGLQLEIVRMKDWQRGDWFDSTGLPWISPSPNMRNLDAATLYPGIAMIEGSKNYSVGRGTDSPMQTVGAEFIRGRDLARVLNARQIAGVRVYPVTFEPNSSNLAGKKIGGVRFVITNRERVNSTRLGLEIASALHKLYPGKIDFEVNQKLIANEATIRALKDGVDPRLIEEGWEESLARFLTIRSKYLLY